MNVLVHLALGGAAAAVMYGAFRLLGPVGLAYTAPVLGLAFAKPIVELLAAYPRLVTRFVLRKVDGRYFEYRGASLDIHIDERAICWISTADLRKIVALPADPVLRRLYPLQCRELGKPVEWRLGGEALIEFLGKSTETDMTKFSHWIDRNVVTPARNRRKRDLGTDRLA
ncbi:MAG: hypothetical protein ABJD97_14695 [Betaproteobacteria bacterium]